jgi:DNA-binding NarL/FixJ family response regulator
VGRAWTPAAEALLRGLPPRLLEIADLLVHSGLSYKEIAAAMGISDGTVRVHVQQLYRRLGVRSRPRLVELLRGRGEG